MFTVQKITKKDLEWCRRILYRLGYYGNSIHNIQYPKPRDVLKELFAEEFVKSLDYELNSTYGSNSNIVYKLKR